MSEQTETQAQEQSTARLLGLKRGGPAPVETRKGQPLRPFTVPNLVSYIRLALIPLFLVVAFSTENGRSVAVVVIFTVATWSDYLDGILARALNQYSRLGSLLDPAVDRLLTLAAMAVVWHFNLLPRWAIAVVVARELLVIVTSPIALKRGVEIEINWAGRISLWLMMFSVWFSFIAPGKFVDFLFVAGVGIMVGATLAYFVDTYRKVFSAEKKL